MMSECGCSLLNLERQVIPRQFGRPGGTIIVLNKLIAGDGRGAVNDDAPPPVSVGNETTHVMTGAVLNDDAAGQRSNNE